MRTGTQLGKIISVKIGFGGYQNSMIGYEIKIGSPTWDYNIESFQHWSEPPENMSEETAETREKDLGNYLLEFVKLLKDAKVMYINDLVGIPVEAEFDDDTIFKRWRILKEVL